MDGYIQTRDNRVFGAYENAVEALLRAAAFPMPPTTWSPATFQFQGASILRVSSLLRTIRYWNHHSELRLHLQLPVGPPAFSRNNRYNDGACYVQDAWKVRPRLTLNLGLRWEYYGVQHNADPSWIPTSTCGTGANIYQQVRTGTVQIANQSPVGGLWAKDKNNLGSACRLCLGRVRKWNDESPRRIRHGL